MGSQGVNWTTKHSELSVKEDCADCTDSEYFYQVLNQSIKAGVVPNQWKTAVITPVAKVKQPSLKSDFRPISVTPVLSRMLERSIVKSFIYHAIQLPTTSMRSDQQVPRPQH